MKKTNNNPQPMASHIVRKGRIRRASSVSQTKPHRKTRFPKGIEEFLRLHQAIGSINEYGDLIIIGVRIC